MKKFINKPIDFNIIDWEKFTSLEILVSTSHIKDLALCLQMLWEGVISSFVFSKNKNGSQLEITCGAESDFNPKIHNDRIKVDILETELNHLRYFTLCYYRDGAAAVDHIDIETPDGGDITFKFEESKPPVSEQEARRRLGMSGLDFSD